jgi:hypothetical protein
MVRMSTPKTYTKVCPQTWELVRAAYLSGLSATVVARRFGVTLSCLRKRASREGWTKAALARANAPALPAEERPKPSLDPRVLVKTSLEQAALALADGRPFAARACASAGEAMLRLADANPAYEEVDSVSESEARQRWFVKTAYSMAIDFADLMLRGEPLPPALVEAERDWRTLTGRAPGARP